VVWIDPHRVHASAPARDHAVAPNPRVLRRDFRIYSAKVVLDQRALGVVDAEGPI